MTTPTPDAGQLVSSSATPPHRQGRRRPRRRLAQRGVDGPQRPRRGEHRGGEAGRRARGEAAEKLGYTPEASSCSGRGWSASSPTRSRRRPSAAGCSRGRRGGRAARLRARRRGHALRRRPAGGGVPDARRPSRRRAALRRREPQQLPRPRGAAPHAVGAGELRRQRGRRARLRPRRCWRRGRGRAAPRRRRPPRRRAARRRPGQRQLRRLLAVPRREAGYRRMLEAAGVRWRKPVRGG